MRKQKTTLNKRSFLVNFRQNWLLHVMLLFPFVYILIFHYLPIYGIQIAFRDYSPRAGITGSPWVGLKNFKKFFSNYKWKLYVKNTLILSLYSIIVGFPIPIILALVLHVSENKTLKKITQNITYFPHFISVVVMVGILNQVLSPVNGFYGSICKFLGITITSDIRSDPRAFAHLYVWSGIWQNMGWSSIIYLSALSGVSQELHEAAKLDGASRLRRVFAVDLPAIMPTIAIMLILRFGSVMGVGHEKVLLMQYPLNMNVSEVISTYVYKNGIGANEMGYGTAVGLMNSVINTTMVVVVNKVANALSNGEAGLF